MGEWRCPDPRNNEELVYQKWRIVKFFNEEGAQIAYLQVLMMMTMNGMMSISRCRCDGDIIFYTEQQGDI